MLEHILLVIDIRRVFRERAFTEPLDLEYRVTPPATTATPSWFNNKLTARYKAVQDRSSPPPGTRIQDAVAAATSAAAAAAATAVAAAETKRVLDELLGGGNVESLQELPLQLEIDTPMLLQHLPK